MQRFYSARYYSLFSNSFAEGSSVQDENGVYVGATWSPGSRWTITAYSDFAYFAWPKYHTRQSTQSWDHLLNILCLPARSWTLGARVRYKEKAGNATGRLRFYASVTTKTGVPRRVWIIRSTAKGMRAAAPGMLPVAAPRMLPAAVIC